MMVCQDIGGLMICSCLIESGPDGNFINWSLLIIFKLWVDHLLHVTTDSDGGLT